MPNHCENDLWITGEGADVTAVLALIGADRTPPVFDFNALIPYPEPYASMDRERPEWPAVSPNHPEHTEIWAAYREAVAAYKAKWGTESDGFNSGGIEWRRAHWGTKWGAYDVARRDYDGRVCVSFQTAWSPPHPIVIALAKCFPTVTFTLEYFEQGMEYAGGFSCPSEDDWWDEGQAWEPGAVCRVWEVKGYRGRRGG